jgi:5-methylcytosine-specific restriction endonuclease McrA
VPNAPGTPYRIAQYYQWFKQGSLELKPPFQRKPVWSERTKCFLIDTILNNMPMPEVYIQIETNKDGSTNYVVVDGQQRMRAILEYIEGEYSLLEDECSSKYAHKEFKDLPDGVKKDFWSYQIVTRELPTSDLNEVKEVFRRLNKYVMPLNAQELRNATYGGHFLIMINNIAENDVFWSDNKIVTPNEIKRMIDAEYISELIIGMLHGIQQKDQDSIDGFYKQYDEKFTQKEVVLKEFNYVEHLIQDIFGDDLSKMRWKGKPDFYSLFLAIYDLSKMYYFSPEKYEAIKSRLQCFASEVDKHVRQSEKEADSKLVREYVENVEKRSTHKSTRQNRYNIVRQLIIPYLVAKDTRRAFNEEERKIAWALSLDKICAICGQKIDFNDYELDHKIPFSIGGKTSIENSQITHKTCNAKKSNK